MMKDIDLVLEWELVNEPDDLMLVMPLNPVRFINHTVPAGILTSAPQETPAYKFVFDKNNMQAFSIPPEVFYSQPLRFEKEKLRYPFVDDMTNTLLKPNYRAIYDPRVLTHGPYTQPSSSANYLQPSGPRTYPQPTGYQDKFHIRDWSRTLDAGRPTYVTSKVKRKAKVIHRARHARDSVFTMSPQEDQRLVLAIAVVLTLTGGLEQSKSGIINWGFVHQIFEFKFDQRYCRERWSHVRGKHTVTLEHMQQKFRKAFIEAYEMDELEHVDLAFPETINWTFLVDWFESKLGDRDINMLDLPPDRDEFDKNYNIEMPDEVYNLDRDEYFNPVSTELRREEVANELCPLDSLGDWSEAGSEKADPRALERSRVRANVLTPEPAYNWQAATVKLAKLKPGAVDRTVEELLGQKIIRAENKGRRMPGRNYAIGDAVLTAFKRNWEYGMLREAANFKQVLDTALKRDGKFALNYHAPDGHMMAIMNLEANGRVFIEPLLPPVNNDHDAPWPKLTQWGLLEGSYKTVHMDKERLNWGLELRSTETYAYGNQLKDVPPPLEKQFEGEVGPRLPFWTDIHGRLMREHWTLLLTSTVYLLALRPGLTAAGMEKMFKGKLWAWELEMFLEWAGQSGVARKIEVVEGAVGWTTGEWWWMAFADPPVGGMTNGVGA